MKCKYSNHHKITDISYVYRTRKRCLCIRGNNFFLRINLLFGVINRRLFIPLWVNHRKIMLISLKIILIILGKLKVCINVELGPHIIVFPQMFI